MNEQAQRALNVGDEVVYVPSGLSWTPLDRGYIQSKQDEGVVINWASGWGNGLWRYGSCGVCWDYVRFLRSDAGYDRLRAELADYKRILGVAEKTNAELRAQAEEQHKLREDYCAKFEALCREEFGAALEAEKKVSKALAQTVRDTLNKASRQVDSLTDDVKREMRNSTYYRDLLLQIAEVLGPEKFICDSGDIAQDVLIAKVPELARAAILSAKAAEQKAKIVPQAPFGTGWGPAPAQPTTVANCITQQCQSSPLTPTAHEVLAAAGFIVVDEPPSGVYDAIVENNVGEKFGVVIM
jgi:gas vesicle protein